MRAVVLSDFGASPEVTDLEMPEPGQGEVRVRVHAASVNGFDTAVASGYLKDMMEHRFPVVLGKDFAGTIDAVGAAELQPGQTVLIAGATGGVGNQAVRLAVKSGATVIATARTEQDRQLVTELGAAETVDYADDVATVVRQLRPGGADVVLHFAGDPAALLAAVRSGGRFVSTLVGSPEQLPAPDATVVGIYANPDAATLDRLAASRGDGTTRVSVQRTYHLDQAPAALADFGGGTLGKLIITTS